MAVHAAFSPLFETSDYITTGLSGTSVESPATIRFWCISPKSMSHRDVANERVENHDFGALLSGCCRVDGNISFLSFSLFFFIINMTG
jgi:hypothetical protein